MQDTKYTKYIIQSSRLFNYILRNIVLRKNVFINLFKLDASSTWFLFNRDIIIRHNYPKKANILVKRNRFIHGETRNIEFSCVRFTSRRSKWSLAAIHLKRRIELIEGNPRLISNRKYKQTQLPREHNVKLHDSLSRQFLRKFKLKLGWWDDEWRSTISLNSSSLFNIMIVNNYWIIQTILLNSSSLFNIMILVLD